MKIPSGHGAGVISHPGKNAYLHNFPVVIREAYANAQNYGATAIHATVLELGGSTYLLAMHNGEPFADVDEIMKKGLTPNESGGRGNAFQGNGLTYCAAYLNGEHPKLVIASHTPKGFAAAAATTDVDRNEWLIRDTTAECQTVLHSVLGERVFRENKVFYLFQVRDNCLAPGSNPDRVASIMGSTAWMCQDMLNGSPMLTVGEATFKPGRFASLSDMWAGTRGSGKRTVVSAAEYRLRYAEHRWVIPTGPFVVTTPTNEFTVRAEIVVDAFPGTMSSSQWMANIRGDTAAEPFKLGGGSGMGVRPLFLGYMTVPVLVRQDQPMFARFKDNSVYHTFRINEVFATLGLPYIDPSSPRPGSDRPFAIFTLRITHLDGAKEKESGEVCPTSTNYFSQMMQRRPDFLFERNRCTEIFRLAARAAAAAVPADMRQWFTAKFPRSFEDRVPILLSRTNTTVGRVNDYVVTDIRTGGVFDKKFQSGSDDYLLAVWDENQKVFVDHLSVSSITRGVEIQAHLDPERTTLRYASSILKSNYAVLKHAHGLDRKQAIPLFGVSVAAMSRLEDDVWVPVEPDDYIHDVMHQPSRGVHVTAGGPGFRLGVVEDVPARPGVGGSPPRRVGLKISLGTSNEQPYRDRDPSIPVTFCPDKKMLFLNPLYPEFAARYIVPDSPDSASTKLLSRLYFKLHVIALGLHEGAYADGVEINIDKIVNSIKLNDESVPIYNDDRMDWILNQVAVKVLNDDEEVQEIFRKVDALRQSSAVA